MNTSIKKSVLALVVTALVTQSVGAIEFPSLYFNRLAQKQEKAYLLSEQNIDLQKASEVVAPVAKSYVQMAKDFVASLMGYRPSMPKVSMPKISMPKVSMPKVSMPTLESIKAKMPTVESMKANLQSVKLPEASLKNAGIATGVIVGTVAAYKGGQYAYNKYDAYQNAKAQKQAEEGVKALETKVTAFGKEVATKFTPEVIASIAHELRNGTAKFDKAGNLVDKKGTVIVKAVVKAENQDDVDTRVNKQDPKATDVTKAVVDTAKKEAPKKTAWFGRGKAATTTAQPTTEQPKVQEQPKQQVDINQTLATESAKFEQDRKAAELAMQKRLADEKAAKVKKQQDEAAKLKKQQDEQAKTLAAQARATAIKALTACTTNHTFENVLKNGTMAKLFNTAQQAVAQVTDVDVKEAFSKLNGVVSVELKNKSFVGDSDQFKKAKQLINSLK